MKQFAKFVADIIANNYAQMSMARSMGSATITIEVSVGLMVNARQDLRLFGYPTTEEVEKAILNKLAPIPEEPCATEAPVHPKPGQVWIVEATADSIPNREQLNIALEAIHEAEHLIDVHEQGIDEPLWESHRQRFEDLAEKLAGMTKGKGGHR